MLYFSDWNKRFLFILLLCKFMYFTLKLASNELRLLQELVFGSVSQRFNSIQFIKLLQPS